MKFDTKQIRSWVLALSAFVVVIFSVSSARADDYVLTLKDGKFIPEDLVVPADQKIKIIVKNEDSLPAEFESFELNREKLISAKSQIILFIGPLQAGTYSYFDDFHRDTVKGRISAK